MLVTATNALYAHAEVHGCSDDSVMSITSALNRVAEMLRAGARRDYKASHPRGFGESLDMRIQSITSGIVQSSLSTTGTPRPLTTHVAYELLEICGEAIRNSVHHATEMTQVTVRVEWTSASLRISISDNGSAAINGDQVTAGIGRFTMRERAAAIRATVDDAQTSHGYKVTLSLPLTANA